VLGHPACGRDPLTFRRREAICSKVWRERFEDPALWPRTLTAQPFAVVEQARACAAFGPPVGGRAFFPRAPQREVGPV